MSQWESCSCLASAMKGNPGLSEHKAGPPCAVDAQPALSVSLSCAEPRASRAASPAGLWGFLLPPCLPAWSLLESCSASPAAAAWQPPAHVANS